jgi:hypothetical protein
MLVREFFQALFGECPRGTTPSSPVLMAMHWPRQRFQNALVPYAPAGDLDVDHFTAGSRRPRWHR